MQVSLKAIIARHENLIKQNQEKYRHNIVKMKDTKMVNTLTYVKKKTDGLMHLFMDGIEWNSYCKYSRNKKDLK